MGLEEALIAGPEGRKGGGRRGERKEGGGGGKEEWERVGEGAVSRVCVCVCACVRACG